MFSHSMHHVPTLISLIGDLRDLRKGGRRNNNQIPAATRIYIRNNECQYLMCDSLREDVQKADPPSSKPGILISTEAL